MIRAFPPCNNFSDRKWFIGPMKDGKSFARNDLSSEE